MAKSKYSPAIKDAAYEYYTLRDMDVSEIARLLDVPERTIYKWAAADDGAWKTDRERYKPSISGMIAELDKLALELRQAIVDSPSIEQKLFHVKNVKDILEIKEKLDRRIDTLPIVLSVIDDFCRYAQNEADPKHKAEFERVILRWASLYREKQRRAA